MLNYKNTHDVAGVRRLEQPRATVLKVGVLIALLAVGGAAAARAAEEDVEALAKKSQNPVAGENGRSATAPFGLQPFINYNLPHGWAISTSPTFTADWQAGGDHAWTVPVGGSIARTMIVAKQPLTLALAAYYNVDKPLYQADYQIRLTLTFMFPAK